jgi:hypothetical protein
MVSLFALGVTWMGVVAALIAVEKMRPWRRVASPHGVDMEMTTGS